MLLAALAAWTIIVVCMAVGWGLFHARLRRLDGTDEDAYVNGRESAESMA